MAVLNRVETKIDRAIELIQAKNIRITELETHLRHVLLFHGLDDEDPVIQDARKYLGI